MVGFRRAPRRIRFVGAQLQRLSGNQCLARAQLEQPGSGSYLGTAVGANPDEEGLRATAKAAAALMQSVGRDHSLEVHGVTVFLAFDQPVVFVELSAKQGGAEPDAHGVLPGGSRSYARGGPGRAPRGQPGVGRGLRHRRVRISGRLLADPGLHAVPGAARTRFVRWRPSPFLQGRQNP